MSGWDTLHWYDGTLKLTDTVWLWWDTLSLACGYCYNLNWVLSFPVTVRYIECRAAPVLMCCVCKENVANSKFQHFTAHLRLITGAGVGKFIHVSLLSVLSFSFHYLANKN